MATPELVEAKPRSPDSRGKNEARRLRRAGHIPAVIYGARRPSLPVIVDPKQIQRILRSESGHNTIFDLEVNGERSKVMIVDWQYEPLRGKLLHIDMKRIAMDERIKVSVPIVLTGEAAGVKQQGGILEQVLREVELECLPADIPSSISVDVSELVFGKVLRVADLPHAGKLKFLSHEDQTVAHIVAVKEEAVPAPEAVAVEGVEAAPAEPEVIKKGKQEVAEEGVAVAEKPEKPEKAEKGEKKEKK